MLTETYRELFTAIATSAGALTGLLFVVVTVREGRTGQSLPVVAQQVRAAAALLSFTNALAVSLFGLVPGTNVGVLAVAFATIGFFFSAAGMRSFLVDPSMQHKRSRHVTFLILVLVFFGFQIATGIQLLINPRNTGLLAELSNLLVISLILGVARAWELVGGRETGIFSSLAVLTGHDTSTQAPAGSSPSGSPGTDGASEVSGVEPGADKS